MSRPRKRVRDRDSESSLDSALFKFGTKFALSLLVVIVILTLIQCTVKKPESPTWDTRLTVPLINRTYSMSELIDKMDQNGISMDADSAISYSASEQVDTVTLDPDNLSTPNLDYLATRQLGLIELPAPILAPVVLDIMLIGGLAAYLPGSVPATSFNIATRLPSASEYSSIGVDTASAWVIVSNNLGFEIFVDSIDLWDVAYNRSIGRKTFPAPIADGGVDSVLYDLSGQTASNNIEARILANTMGGTVLSTSDKNLTTEFRFAGDISVGSATGEIPALSQDFSAPVTLAENDVVYRATLTGGQLDLEIGNQTNLTATLDVTFPDLTLAGVPISFQRTIAPISSSTISLDLTGYELKPTDSSLPQSLQVEVNATIPGSAPQHVTVDQSDQFIIIASLTNLTFGSVSGVFATVTTSFNAIQHSIEVPRGFDSISFAKAVMTLTVESSLEIPGNLNINLSGSNGKSLNISGTVVPGAGGIPAVTTFIDSTVADFLSPLPSEITVSGLAGFGDGINEGTIQAGDYVTAGIDIFAPLELIIGTAVVEPDIVSEEIDQNDIDVITDHVLEARLMYNVINRLPVGASVSLYLSGDSTTVISDPEVSFIDEIFVLAAPTIAGIASDTISTGYQTIMIDGADLNVLKNDTLYIGTQITLDDTGGEAVKPVARDYIQIMGRIEVDYRFTGEL